jgi:hypothetical protein
MRYRIQFAFCVLLGFLNFAETMLAQSTFSHGLVQSSCAPWDGPAIDILLTTKLIQCKQTSEPYINIGIWRGLPIHSGQQVRFGPGSSVGFASRCAKAGVCESAESGTILFEAYQTGSGATGRYELHFKSGKALTGTFRLKWCQNYILCG